MKGELSNLPRVILAFGLLLFCIPGAFAQGPPAARCEVCLYGSETCDGIPVGVCKPQAMTKTSCTYSGDCPRMCQEHADPSCGGAAAATAEGCSPKATLQAVRSLIQQQQDEDQKTHDEREDDTDVKIQNDLLADPAGPIAATRMEPQYRAPAMFVEATHGGKDMLFASKVLNMSEKTIVAIQISWFIRMPGENVRTESKLVNFEKGLPPEEVIDLPGQNLDTAPILKRGTVVRFFISQVKFKDGTSWERKFAKDSNTKDSNTALALQKRNPAS